MVIQASPPIPDRDRGFDPGPGAARGPGFSFLDLFAGIGGIRLGLERAGGRCVYSVEIDEHARRTYEANFGPCGWLDVRTLDPARLPSYDLLAAGFPCQPFSRAGVSKKNSLGRPHGFDDEKSGDLFFEIIRVIEATHPRVVFLENVKGLKRHDGGRTFAVIQDELREQGYRVFDTVLSARYWVPQVRERTFIVALSHKDFGPEPTFEFPATPEGPSPKLRDVLDPDFDPKYRLTSALWEYLQGYALKHRAAGHGFGYRLYGPDDVTGTLSARYYKDGAEILVQTDEGAPRRLSPVEAARLMGFPSPFVGTHDPREIGDPDAYGFALPSSDRQAWQQLGNSVVVPAVAHLALSIAPIIASARSANSRE